MSSVEFTVYAVLSFPRIFACFHFKPCELYANKIFKEKSFTNTIWVRTQSYVWRYFWFVYKFDLLNINMCDSAARRLVSQWWWKVCRIKVRWVRQLFDANALKKSTQTIIQFLLWLKPKCSEIECIWLFVILFYSVFNVASINVAWDNFSFINKKKWFWNDIARRVFSNEKRSGKKET